jgi:acyl dehydratase
MARVSIRWLRGHPLRGPLYLGKYTTESIKPQAHRSTPFSIGSSAGKRPRGRNAMPSPLVIPNVAAFPEFEGRDLGTTKWHTVDQEQIDAFAEATGDRQWIHVDRERAERESPFGTTIAHGYLTVALAPAMLPALIEVEGCSQIVNYGIEKLRLREPVPSGSRIRLAGKVGRVRKVPGGAMRVALEMKFEVEGAKRPACSGELVFVYFP